ncbi:MAG: T9SS type A sorting domain-containing protein [Syntrophothermus sp.]
MKILFIVLILFNSITFAQDYKREFNRLYFLTADIGWVTFAKDTLDKIETTTYKTSNGGLTWVPLSSEFSDASIDFVNDSVGFLYNNYLFRPHIWKTIDKGETWELMSEGLFNSGLDFITENVGYGVLPGHPYYLVKTTNSGVTWDTMSYLPFLRTLSIVLTETKLLVYDFTNDSVRYWLSTDSGIIWEPKYSTNFLVYFYDSSFGYSYNIKDSCLYRTTDGGETWVKKVKMVNFVFPIDSLNAIGGEYEMNRGTFFLTHDGFTTYETKFSNRSVKEYSYKSCNAFYACGEYYYLAKSTDCGNTWIPLTIEGLPSFTDVNEETLINSYSLEQNYPNPFNPTTTISYSLLNSGFTTLKVYDILGNEVATLVNEEKGPGNYTVDFNAINLSSGVYFYTLTSGSFTMNKKMVLMK